MISEKLPDMRVALARMGAAYFSIASLTSVETATFDTSGPAAICSSCRRRVEQHARLGREPALTHGQIERVEFDVPVARRWPRAPRARRAGRRDWRPSSRFRR